MKESKLYWFHFSQNNSGGSFVVDDKLASRLFVQEENADRAVSFAENLGVYFDGVNQGRDCPCCGDRWYYPHIINFPLRYSEMNIFETVEEYAQFMANEYGWTTPDAYIYYKNGQITKINKQNKKQTC